MFQKQPISPIHPPAQSHGTDTVETIVGPSVHVEGDFASEGNILVKGTVSGSVKTSQLLTVEKGARIFANVNAANAFIAGEVKGNVKVTDKLELTATARILGDIFCSIIAVEPGALVQGKIQMKGIAIQEEANDRKKIASKISSADEKSALGGKDDI